MAYFAAGVAGAGVLFKGISGAIQKGQANKIARNNAMPMQVVQPEYEQNVRDAENMAQVGLPQQQYNNQLNQINRSQAGGIMSLSRSANPGAGLASLLRASNDATGQLNAQDAAAIMQNRLRLQQQRQIFAGQKQSAWDWNFKQKYLTNLEKEQALRGAGQQNLNSAATDAVNLGGTLLAAEAGQDSPQKSASSQQMLTTPLGSPNLYKAIYPNGNPYGGMV